MSTRSISRHSVPDLIRRFSALIALFWLGLAVVTNVFVPQLEHVAETHNVSLSPQDAPSLQASRRIGKVFHEFDSDSAAMIVLEGEQPLGADAHHYYDGLVEKLESHTWQMPVPCQRIRWKAASAGALAANTVTATPALAATALSR